MLNETESYGLAVCLDLVALRPVLCAGVDNVAHILIVVSARSLAVDDGWPGVSFRRPLPQEPALIESPERAGFGDIEVYLKVPRGASYAFHRDLPRSEGIWNAPDLTAGMETLGLARICLPASAVPPVGESVRIAARLRCVPFNAEHSMTSTGSTLSLTVVAADQYQATADEAFVREVLDEAEEPDVSD